MDNNTIGLKIDKTLKQKTISGMIWVGIQKFGTLIITFLSNIVLARLLTPNDYGMIGMLAIFIAISNTFIDGGFGSALIQKTNPTQEDYSTVFYWNILLGFLLYGILFIGAPWIEYFYKDIIGLSEVLRVQGIVLIINALTIVQFNKLRKNMNFKLLAKINVASATISVVVAIMMAVLGFGVWALVGQQIVLSVVNCILLWFSCRWLPSLVFSLSSLKVLFNFGSFILMSSLLNTLGNNINGLLIGKFFTAGTLGYFTQAKKLEDVSSLGVLTVVEQVTYPMLVEVKEDCIRMANILSRFNSALLAVTMPLLYMIAIMASPIIILLFSDKWLPSSPILQILAIHGIFIVMQGANYNALAAIGKSKALFMWSVFKRASGIVITLALLLLFGFYGLLWGIVLTGALIAFCNMYLVAKYISFPVLEQFKQLMPIILLSTIPFIGLFSLQVIILKANVWNPIFIDIVLGIFYIIIYVLALCKFPSRSISIIRKEIINIYYNKITKRNHL